MPSLQRAFQGVDYSLVSNNCCHFCEAFALRLGVVAPPLWLNKLARAGARLGL